MDINDVDPALRDATQKLPALDVSRAALRTLMRVATRVVRVPKIAGVAVRTVKADGIRLRIYLPETRRQEGALFWIHGGGLLFGGESAGGGLAAALVQRLHDGDGVKPIGQWLFAPMIDDRTAADASLDETDHWVWNNRSNRVGWSGYIPATFGTDDVPAYAAAARRSDLTGLPPAYLAVGDIELGRVLSRGSCETPRQEADDRA